MKLSVSENGRAELMVGKAHAQAVAEARGVRDDRGPQSTCPIGNGYAPAKHDVEADRETDGKVGKHMPEKNVATPTKRPAPAPR